VTPIVGVEENDVQRFIGRIPHSSRWYRSATHAPEGGEERRRRKTHQARHGQKQEHPWDLNAESVLPAHTEKSQTSRVLHRRHWTGTTAVVQPCRRSHNRTVLRGPEHRSFAPVNPRVAIDPQQDDNRTESV
jgi:hypothetical protein